jgi:hypothetical protein
MNHPLFTDWFIINIINHTNMTTLSNLKLTNKFFNKNITKKDLVYCINNIIKRQTPNNLKYELSYWFLAGIDGIVPANKDFIHKPGPIIIPPNTLWKFKIDINVPNHYDDYLDGEIKNVFNQITIIQSEPHIKPRLWHQVFGKCKLNNHRNIISLSYPNGVRAHVNATMTIQEFKF